jgi:hypothetical protein
MDITITLLLVAALFLILGCGVWVGLTLTGVAGKQSIIKKKNSRPKSVF